MAGPTESRLQPPARVSAPSNSLRTNQASVGATANAEAPPTDAGYTADNPRQSGDWDGYLARRTEALAPLQAQSDASAAVIASGDAGNPAITQEQYDTARQQQIIANTNLATTTPDFLSPNGQFQPGDLEGYARQQAASSSDMFGSGNGRAPLTPEQQQASFDSGLANMTPDQRTAFWQNQSNDYRQVRATEVGQADLRARMPGALGEAAAQAYGLGLLNPVEHGASAGGSAASRIMSMRGSPKPAAPATSCATCSPAVPSDPGGGGAAPAANRPPPTSNRVDPALRARVDAMRRGDVMPLQRGGKDGLLEHLSTQPDEFGVYRTPGGQMYLTRGTTNEVPPQSYGDTLVFHNHPSGTQSLSGTMYPGGTGYSSGDLGYIQQTSPEQRSTVLGSPNAITRPVVPRAEYNPPTDWDAIDRMIAPK